MERFRDDEQLITELRALRPTPRPAFAAELDERAAAGFPRRSAVKTDRAPIAALAERMRALTPRRLMLPAGAVALTAIAVATAAVATSEPDSGGELSQSVPHSSAVRRGAPQVKEFSENLSSGKTRDSSAAQAASGEAPLSTELPPSSGGAGGPSAASAPQRDVERSAEIVLGADPADVAGDASEVFETVHVYDGIVMRSSTREGAAGQAGAEFELLIPSAKLSDALAAFSAIDEVRSRHEATADITAPTVTVSELLQDSEARIDGLLAQLADAETDAEREAVEAELRREHRHAAALRARLTRLHRRANFARVSLRIETGTSTISSDGSGWGIGDALRDAGQILAIAAAVTLVGLAIVGPVALVALLAWLAHRTWVRRSRQRALG